MPASNGNVDLGPAVDQLLNNLETRWHASDSEGFAQNFHSDADFVDVLGRIVRGRAGIARIHRQNFDTIHLDSRLRLERLTVRKLSENVALAHVKASLHVPAGPLAGDARATQTLVLETGGGEWQIRAFHNTFVREMPGVPGTED